MYSSIKFLLLGFLLTMTWGAFAQEKAKSNQELKEEFMELNTKLEGTYQIQISESRLMPSISFDLLKEIDRERSENETIFIRKEHYLIKVPSREEINSEEFEFLEKVVYTK